MVAALQRSSCGANGVAIGIGAVHGCRIESGRVDAERCERISGR